ncbi:MAG: helix-turn-helix transcriptional regulator [Candidatus Omnitrophota bacterium]
MDNKIKEYREKLGLSQSDLQNKTSIDQSLIARYEIGEVTPPIPRAQKLAEALGTTITELFPNPITDDPKVA